MLEDKLSTYLDLISKAIAKAGPQVTQLALEHERWSGVNDIGAGLFFLVVFVVCGLIVKRNWKVFMGSNQGPGFAVFLALVGCIISLIVACAELLDVWNWLAIFNPKLALFHEVVTKFLSK